jgi:hypothetical protein
MGQREGRGRVSVPLLGMIGDPGTDLDKPPDEATRWSASLPRHDVKLPEHVKQVVG